MQRDPGLQDSPIRRMRVCAALLFLGVAGACGGGGGGGGGSGGGVTPPPAVVPPSITAFSAGPSTITAGQSSTLSWTVSGATSLSLDNGIGTVTGSSRSVTPSSTTTYVLTATNGGGSVTASATVTVTGAGGSSVVIPLVVVDSPGNAADARNSLGAVSYRYSIAKFEITTGQYVAFLNAVARTDPYGLYASNVTDMSTWPTGPRITRSGNDGSYTYSVAADYADRPINFISWGDAARFCNWLHNGQPTGPQGPTTTERGSYALDGATSDAQYIAVTRRPGATYVLPTENEWYKAAYFEPGITAANKYWDFATRSNATPSNLIASPDPGNNANFFQNDRYSLSGFLRTVVGEFENSEGPWGSFDQMGNVGEWTETIRSAGFAVRGESYSTGDSGGATIGYRFVRSVMPTEEETKNGLRVAFVGPGGSP